MKLKTLFVIAAIVGILFGLGFLVAPVWTEASYGINLDAGGQLMARFLGAIYTGFAITLWLVRNSPNSPARRALVIGSFFSMLLSFVVAVYDRVMAIENALAWSTVLVTLLLTIGFGYFWFIKPDAE